LPNPLTIASSPDIRDMLMISSRISTITTDDGTVSGSPPQACRYSYSCQGVGCH
jgi:hypothetical protein